jgi:superfamily II DNA or RNA helicase
MRIALHTNRLDDYQLFLKIKSLPRYEFRGREAIVPDEYAARLGMEIPDVADVFYRPLDGLFDYQRDITALALRRRKFAVFAEPGLGKTNIALGYAQHVLEALPRERCALIVSPLMVVRQTMAEAARFYGDSLPMEQVRAADLGRWLESGSGRLGITNYEALRGDVPQERLGCLILDESSLLKSAYGKWGQECIRLGKGLDWKLALTGTPAPNDRIEYANHAVFLDAFPTVNSFLARFFVNRGQTDNRWELKPHALGPFYRALSHWCIFLSNPATYGWKDNVGTLPPIHVHIHEVDLTAAQRDAVRLEKGTLFAIEAGGITGRSALSQIAKGHHRGQTYETLKPVFIRSLVESWPDESTLIWCKYNAEQDAMGRMFPNAASIAGSTPYEERASLIEDFQAGRRRLLISKADVLGFGLNLQIATRQIFNGLHDSWEEYYQAIKRSNRVGSTKPLNVHVPATEIEMPMIDNVLRKARRIEEDTAIQERMFKDAAL